MDNLKQRTISLLRKSERIFKTDMVYLIGNGFWLGSGQVISTLSVFVMSLIFANTLPKEVYGNYKFIISIAGILGALSLSGMGAVVTQGVAQGSEGILKDAVKTTLRWGILLFIASISISAYYFFQGNSTLGFALIIIGITLPLTNSFGLFGSYLSGKKNFRLGTIFNTASQITTTALLVIIGITTKSVLAMVATYFIANTLTILLGYIYIKNRFHIGNVQDHTLIPYSKHLSYMNFFAAVATQLDKILVFHYLGAIELAIYSFAQAIPEQVKGAFKSLFGIAVPKYAVLSEKDLRTSVIKKTLQLSILAAVFVGFYLLSAHFIFSLLFPKYAAAIFYSQIYALGLITIPGTSLFFLYFQIKKDTTTMYKLQGINAVCTILFSFIFIYKYGLLGAVIENNIDWTIFFIANCYYFSKSANTYSPLPS